MKGSSVESRALKYVGGSRTVRNSRKQQNRVLWAVVGEARRGLTRRMAAQNTSIGPYETAPTCRSGIQAVNKSGEVFKVDPNCQNYGKLRGQFADLDMRVVELRVGVSERVET